MATVDYLNYPPIDTSVFPADYDSARRLFMDLSGRAADSFPSELTSFPCPGVGPNGGELSSDCIWLGDLTAQNVVVLLAGTHGVEGYVGSAVEFDHLRLVLNQQISLSYDNAILIVHALTPWGYAWNRRCDENGIDLNRNAIDFSVSPPLNPGYEALREALFSDNKAHRANLLEEFGQIRGRVALEIAISGGQFTDPFGPFYGGANPAHGRQVTEWLIEHYQLAKRNLTVIDLHSGLGPYGYGEVICDHPLESQGIISAQRLYGDSVTLPALGTSSSVPKAGLMDYIWHEIMTGRSCHVTLEFGTYSTNDLFDVLLEDHRLWAKSGNDSEKTAHGQLMLRHFCPQDKAWRALVLFRARQVIWQAITGTYAK